VVNREEGGMSKQKRAKETQRWRHKPEWPVCGNCRHFTSEQVPTEYAGQTYWTEKNMRCSVGGFKVGKTDTCDEHEER